MMYGYVFCDQYSVPSPPPSPPPSSPPPSPPPPRTPPPREYDEDDEDDGAVGVIFGVMAIVVVLFIVVGVLKYIHDRKRREAEEVNVENPTGAVMGVQAAGWQASHGNANMMQTHQPQETNIEIPITMQAHAMSVGEHEMCDLNDEGPPPPSTAAMAPDIVEKRAMLVRFYHKHNPEQAEQVDAIMQEYTVADIREACMTRYNADPFDEEPPPPSTAAMAPDVVEKRAMLAYTVEDIREACMTRYNADPFDEEPPPPSTAAMAPDVVEKRAMLVRFYHKHNPEQAEQVDAIMQAYTVEDIREACMTRYKGDPFKPRPDI
ncbi:hypothetical protein CYMTET_31208 [Cymbomonas tetramitiformis]|uniref:Uncharacterized protein n=1 Tax=Cymbomonas tetramitiformis TaxID=36881 RepID=A0AAE0FHL2_9CHLO|nr:hypothetical protein CYMTET_31208 [Cymbomonas tetramitiformis]